MLVCSHSEKSGVVWLLAAAGGGFDDPARASWQKAGHRQVGQRSPAPPGKASSNFSHSSLPLCEVCSVQGEHGEV